MVNVTVPASYPADAFQALKDVAPQARFLIRLRAIADWLSVDHAAYMHGESTLEGEAYGKWIDMFVAGDRVLRFTYDFEGCIFGVKGCDGASPTGHAPVLCDACVEVRK